MNKHRYCCQNAAQNYLDHIIPVPDFDVNPQCLIDGDRQSFIAGLQKLTDIVADMYTDMIGDPAGYGLPLAQDIDGAPHDPKVDASTYAANRLITALYILAHTGVLHDDCLEVNKDAFAAMLKEKRSSYFKIANHKAILGKLCDFGFRLDDFRLSYPDSGEVIKALYGYMSNTALNRDALMALNYHVVAQQQHQAEAYRLAYAAYLSGEEKAFFLWLHDTYMKEGFHCVDAGYGFMRHYHLNPKEKKRALRITSNDGRLGIACKLYHIGDYNDDINAAPESIKQVFRNVKTCSRDQCLYKRDTCICRVDYTLDGQHYKACTFERFFAFSDFTQATVPFYKSIFAYEAKKQQGNT